MTDPLAAVVDKLVAEHVHLAPVYVRGGILRQWIDADGTMHVEEIAPEDFYVTAPLALTLTAS